MTNFRKIAAPAFVGFIIGWALIGVYFLLFPPQGAAFGNSASDAVGSLFIGGGIGAFLGIVRGYWTVKSMASGDDED